MTPQMHDRVREPASTRLPAARAALAQRRAEHPLLTVQRTLGNRYVQRRVRGGPLTAPPDVERAIEGARGGGSALDGGVRTSMESAFGADFGGVRVHTDSGADALSRSLSARAFTTGNDIFFRSGAYDPGASGGRELLAHELTHVVQQADGIRAALTVNEPGDQYEDEADSVAGQVMRQLESEEEPEPV
jgi:hypothetical protein